MEENNLEYEPIPPTPLRTRVIRAVIALVALGALIYFSGIYQYLFLQRTPAGVEQSVLESKVDAERITIPVVVHVLAGESGSARTEEDVSRLLVNANNIWAQANVEFRLQEVQTIATTDRDLQAFQQNPFEFIEQTKTYDPGVANVYLTRTLSGVNGLAYGGTNAVSVADFTSNLDFRTLAHEFGHLLGLNHVNGSRRLMSTGASGVELTMEEIQTARQEASSFLP